MVVETGFTCFYDGCNNGVVCERTLFRGRSRQKMLLFLKPGQKWALKSRADGSFQTIYVHDFPGLLKNGQICPLFKSLVHVGSQPER